MAYYLIDFENVKNIHGIQSLSESDTVIFFYTKNSDKLGFSLHREIISAKAKFAYFEVESGGKHALDFQLSTYLGYLAGANPEERFYIVSKDNGYNNVIKFWSDYREGTRISLLEDICASSEIADENIAKSENAEAAESAPKEEGEKPKAKTKRAAVRKRKLPAKGAELGEQELSSRLHADEKLNLTEEDSGWIADVVAKSETKEQINNSLSKRYKDNGIVSKLMKALRPYIKNKG